MKIRIIGSKPNEDQEPLPERMLGIEADAKSVPDQPGRVSIHIGDEGAWILNPGEYEILETKPSNEK